MHSSMSSMREFSIVECCSNSTKKLRFLISDAPTQKNLKKYIEIYKQNEVMSLVRACASSYDEGPLEQAGIQSVDLSFPDGSSPSSDIVHRWLQLVEHDLIGAENEKGRPTVAVHCVAGLGRAPVLVAIALMEFCAMSALDAVEYIRSVRRGCINCKQLQWLLDYRPMKAECCVVM
eukprot:114618_1